MKRKNILFRSGANVQKAPSWFKWVILFFVAYILSQAFFRPEPPATAKGTSSQPARSSLFSEQGVRERLAFDQFRQKLFPGSDPNVYAKDNLPGKGAEAFCGTEVELVYDAYLPENTAIEKGRKLRFRIGDKAAMPALSQAVETMRAGGKRSVLAPYSLSYGVEGFGQPNVPKGAQIRFEVQLLSVTPAVEEKAFSFRHFEDKRGRGDPLRCGEKASVTFTLFRLDGTKIYQTAQPLSFTVGGGEVALGLEQGVIGMGERGKRTLLMPPAYQTALRAGKSGKAQIPWPGKEVVLVEMERMAEKE